MCVVMWLKRAPHPTPHAHVYDVQVAHACSPASRHAPACLSASSPVPWYTHTLASCIDMWALPRVALLLLLLCWMTRALDTKEARSQLIEVLRHVAPLKARNATYVRDLADRHANNMDALVQALETKYGTTSRCVSSWMTAKQRYLLEKQLQNFYNSMQKEVGDLCQIFDDMDRGAEKEAAFRRADLNRNGLLVDDEISLFVRRNPTEKGLLLGPEAEILETTWVGRHVLSAYDVNGDQQLSLPEFLHDEVGLRSFLTELIRAEFPNSVMQWLEKPYENVPTHDLVEQLENFYKVMSPDRIGSIEGTAQRWADDQERLHESLLRKYFKSSLALWWPWLVALQDVLAPSFSDEAFEDDNEYVPE